MSVFGRNFARSSLNCSDGNGVFSRHGSKGVQPQVFERGWAAPADNLKIGPIPTKIGVSCREYCISLHTDVVFVILDISTFFLAFSLGRSGSDFDFRRKLLRTFHGITNGVPSTLFKNKNSSQKQKVQLTSFNLVPVRAANSEWSSRTVQLKFAILILC